MAGLPVTYFFLKGNLMPHLWWLLLLCGDCWGYMLRSLPYASHLTRRPYRTTQWLGWLALQNNCWLAIDCLDRKQVLCLWWLLLLCGWWLPVLPMRIIAICIVSDSLQNHSVTLQWAGCSLIGQEASATLIAIALWLVLTARMIPTS